MVDSQEEPGAVPNRPAPWSMPVPVRKSDFIPLHEEHRDLSVITDMGAIPTFGITTNDFVEDCAHCDFQLIADYPAHRRLGSGRAAFYRGRYLKGIGRTPLAANWGQPNDSWHGSGHMQASAAVREFVVTEYLRARGLEHTVVPCEGLLVRRMPEDFRRALCEYTDKIGLVLPPVDRELQAITIKPGHFARWSNFLWLLVHGPGTIQTMIDFGRLLQEFANPLDPPPSPGECAPTTIVDSIRGAVERARENFRAYFRAGVYWGSFGNNSTLDGRFLDLEVPTIVGKGQFYGILHRPTMATIEGPGRVRVLGEGVLDYARQMRKTLEQIQARLRDFGSRTASTPARSFAEDIAARIGLAFGETHWIYSRSAQQEMLREMYATTNEGLDLGPRIASMVSEAHGEGDGVNMNWRVTDIEFARPEPATRMMLCLPEEDGGAVHAHSSDAQRVVNDALRELDELRTVDDVLAGLRQCTREISMPSPCGLAHPA